jgi:hypothetical protein
MTCKCRFTDPSSHQKGWKLTKQDEIAMRKSPQSLFHCLGLSSDCFHNSFQYLKCRKTISRHSGSNTISILIKHALQETTFDLSCDL